MSNAPSFRSALNGFNRSDVINFIRELMEENNALNDELAELKNEFAEKVAEASAEQCDTEALRAELEACKADAEAAQAQLAELETDRQNELMLGRAMYDARRFSDILVQEANDKANSMLDSAAQNAKEISETLSTFSAQTDAFAEYCNNMLAGIRGKLENLNQSLSDFNQELTEKKAAEAAAGNDAKSKARLAVRKVKK